MANITFLMSELSGIEWLATSIRDVRVFEIKKWSDFTSFVKKDFK